MAPKYLEHLIRGEDPPPFRKDGLPDYVRLRNTRVRKRLPLYRIEDR